MGHTHTHVNLTFPNRAIGSLSQALRALIQPVIKFHGGAASAGASAAVAAPPAARGRDDWTTDHAGALSQRNENAEGGARGGRARAPARLVASISGQRAVQQLINVDDLLMLLGQYGSECPVGSQEHGDFNIDGYVGVADLLLLLSQFGREC